jgi:hypothetical protein
MAGFIDLTRFRHRREIKDLQEEIRSSFETTKGSLERANYCLNRLEEIGPGLYYEMINSPEYRGVVDQVRVISED